MDVGRIVSLPTRKPMARVPPRPRPRAGSGMEETGGRSSQHSGCSAVINRRRASGGLGAAPDLLEQRDSASLSGSEGEESPALTAWHVNFAAGILRNASENGSDATLRAIFKRLSPAIRTQLIEIASEQNADVDAIQAAVEPQPSRVRTNFSRMTESNSLDYTFAGMGEPERQRIHDLLASIRELFQAKGARDVETERFTLRREGLANIFKELQMPLLRFEVDRVFNRIDVNGDGDLTWKEFTEAAMQDDFLAMLVKEGQQMKQCQVPNDYNFAVATHMAHRHQGFVHADRYEQYNPAKHGELHGENWDIRAKIDYSWHVNYTKERQEWQDSVVRRTSIIGAPRQAPWLIFTCGAMGTGKGYTMGWLSQKGYLELENVVRIDPDHFKTMMPEWQGYVANDAHVAGSMCHLESGFLQELTQEVAMSEKQNCWIDGSLHDHNWYTQLFAKTRARYPYYRLAIIYIYAAPEKVFERAEKRGKETGRFVPKEILANSIKKTQEAAEILSPQVDFYAVISNDTGEPLLMKCEDRAHSFRAFSQRFRLFEQISRAFPANMPPIAGVDMPEAMDFFRLTAEVRAGLKHGRQGITSMPIQECCTPAFLQMIGPALQGSKGATHIAVGPISATDAKSRVMCRWEDAPPSAVNMVYCIGAFGESGEADETAVLKCQKSARVLFSSGSIGFNLYVDEEFRIVGVKIKTQHAGRRSSIERLADTSAGTISAFTSAKELEPHMIKKLDGQGRWNLRLFPATKSHAKQCAYILPDEMEGCPAGAVAFVLHNNRAIFFARIPPD